MTASELQPSLDPDAIARSVPQLGAATFRALTENPRLGVFVVTLEGQMMFMNSAAAHMLHGPTATPRTYVGRFWREYMPSEWVEERLEMLRWMRDHHEALCVRTLWRDRQHFAWMSLVEGAFANGQPLVLITAQCVGGWSEDRPAPPRNARSIDSRYIRLERLDRLSPRELEVLAMLGRGMGIREVAQRLYRSEKTIERHRDAIHHKLNISDRAELVKIAASAALESSDVARVRV